ncbi:uncharacterized protein LOC126669710 [Mercurialis annua]|uniref:uncharacterized protein LOC126669710 n=1 Tax=Mercurialis annua TaxID=3986 RepID=UPI00215E1D2E|nr:uncharacterized protein LOC126669710 [Mercurialis annua]
MEEIIEKAINRCKRVIGRIEKLQLLNSINRSCTHTLLKLAHSELAFLSRIPHHQPSIPPSVNIGHLEAVIHILEQPSVTGVSRVCKPIPVTVSVPNVIVHVDIVCIFNKNPVWIIVSDRNPSYISWNECFKSRMQHLLDEARCSHILKPSSILMFFARGIEGLLFEKLRSEFGALEIGLEFDLGEDLEGDWINVTETPYQESVFLEIKIDCDSSNSSISDAVSSLECVSVDDFEGLQEEDTEIILDDSFSSILLDLKLVSEKVQSACDFINFDTTALIALVSGISNGCAKKLLDSQEVELKQRFKGNVGFVMAQALSEIQNPIHAELAGVMRGKRGIICESVQSEFKELVSLCGGPHEQLRAEKLLKHLMVVPDSPSERMMCLPTTRKLAMKNKVVFGTGDRWHTPTLTANMGFVRAVLQTGMSLFTIEHRPRALTGD